MSGPRHALAAALALAACSHDRADTPAPRAAQATAAVQGLVRTDDPHVLAWVSSPWSFSTTSYAIDAPDGLILVDTQFLPKETVQFVDDVERATGKKAALAVVLHANPDKFNGTHAFKERGVRVVTSAQVKALLPAVHEKRVRAFAERYAPDYPRELPSPDVFGDATQELEVAGTRVKLVVTGAGCSAAHVLLAWDGPDGRDVFAGDLIANGAHSWLEIGETLEWKKRLDEIDALLGAAAPARVMPGRGLPGGRELVVNERRYLDDVIAAVAAEHPHGDPDDAALERSKRAIVAKYPALRFAVFLNIGLPAEWKRQAALAGP